ncbi:Arginine N-methyltransferase 2 [Rhodotorula kratochvilovae]
MSSIAPPVSVSLPPNPQGEALASSADLEERVALALRLIDAVYDGDDRLVRHLVEQEKADCWVQDAQGWTALHAAAHTGSVDDIKLLLRKGNAVWSIPDNLGCTAGDIAYSMNNADAYEELLAEGVRAEMLRAILEAAQGDDESDNEGEDAAMDGADGEQPKLSTASDNATFLSSRLVFTHDSRGQPIALDAEGNGVMMGWESGIMDATARAMCEPAWGDRKGRRREALIKEEDDGEREPLRVMNVGFGLGIVDTFLQEYSPTQHLIIEPHPDVLAFARANGWFDKPGVRFYEGTWKQYFKDLESGKEEYVGWDGVYFDTYSEHYADLHAFFQQLPDLLSTSPSARFSFFHGLGATSRLLYDVYTTVSELHLREIGLATQWEEVDVCGLGEGARWEATGAADGTGSGEKKEPRTKGEGEKKYWREEMVGRYRLPLCRLEF